MKGTASRRDQIGISHTVLVAAEALDARLSADSAASALAEGICENGSLTVDPYPLGELRGDFDARMKASRAVVILAPSLDERTLLGSVPFEIATRARQSGVPAYAVTRENDLDPFDARILDLQLVIKARSLRALTQAGVRLAAVI